MKLYKISIRLIVIFISLNINTLNAQVTIGSNEQPLDGAILQLKSFENVTDGSANSDRGLGLPRVQLVDKYSLDPCVTDNNEDPKELIGLLVYNITEGFPTPTSACDPLPNWEDALHLGLMVWNGTNWDALGATEHSTAIPPEWISDEVKFVKDHENNAYPVRKFGDKGIWMLENLRTVRPQNPWNDEPSIVVTSLNYADYNSKANELYKYSKFGYSYVSPPTNASQNTAGYTSPSHDDPTFFNQYPNLGLRYNYNLVLNYPAHQIIDQLDVYQDPSNANVIKIKKDASGKPTKYIQGICPEGWHVPYAFEFSELLSYISTVGDSDPELVGVDPSKKSKVAPMRYPLVTCLPGQELSDNRGASYTSLKGGLALTWNGANSGGGKQKEYGELSTYMVISDDIEKNVSGTTISDVIKTSFVSVSPIRTSYTAWSVDKTMPSNQYSVRCKKNDDSMDDLLEYSDITSSK